VLRHAPKSLPHRRHDGRSREANLRLKDRCASDESHWTPTDKSGSTKEAIGDRESALGGKEEGWC